jgi:hypothetical protein
MASSSASVPATLFWKYLPGCCIDSPTYAYAARWITSRMAYFPSTSSTAPRSPMSARTSGPHCTAQTWPLTRLSSAIGVQPACASALQTWLPM